MWAASTAQTFQINIEPPSPAVALVLEVGRLGRIWNLRFIIAERDTGRLMFRYSFQRMLEDNGKNDCDSSANP